jgi:hypothetical protein
MRGLAHLVRAGHCGVQAAARPHSSSTWDDREVQDPYLAAVTRHVEAGGNPVQVTLALTSGVLVTGFVRRAEFFVSVSKQGAHDAQLAATPVKKRRPETYAEAEVRADAAVRMLRDADESETDAITLSDVQIVWSSGDKLLGPTLRVSTSAIAAWWLGATPSPFKGQQKAGTAAFVGVDVPLG